MTTTTDHSLGHPQRLRFYAEGMADEILAGRTFQASDHDWPGDDPAAAAREAAITAATAHLARVPARFAPATTTRLDAAQHPALLQRWLNHPSARNLLLVGDAGVGKSWTAAALANAFAVKFFRAAGLRAAPVRWWTVAGLLDDLRPSAPDSEAVWQRAKTTPLLVLDDLAHVRPTEWAAERLWLLANARAEADAAWTVVTTNASWVDLEASWGVGTMDRFRDGAAALTLVGPSRRRPLVLADGAS